MPSLCRSLYGGAAGGPLAGQFYGLGVRSDDQIQLVSKSQETPRDEVDGEGCKANVQREKKEQTITLVGKQTKAKEERIPQHVFSMAVCSRLLCSTQSLSGLRAAAAARTSPPAPPHSAALFTRPHGARPSTTMASTSAGLCFRKSRRFE